MQRHTLIALPFLLIVAVITMLELRSYGQFQEPSLHRRGLVARQASSGSSARESASNAKEAASSSTSDATTETSSSSSSSTSPATSSTESPTTSLTQLDTTTTATSSSVTTTTPTTLLTPTTQLATPSTTATTTPTTSAAPTLARITEPPSSSNTIAVIQSSLVTPATTLSVGALVTTLSSSTQVLAPTNAAAANSSQNTFWGNKQAVAGTFSAVGLVVSGVFVAMMVLLLRKQRRRNAEARNTMFSFQDKGLSVDWGVRSPSPAHSINDLSNQTPMDAFAQKDAYHDSYGQGYPPSRNVAPSPAPYYDTTAYNNYTAQEHSYGIPMSNPPVNQGLAPSMNYAASSQYSRPSMDSFYGASNEAPGAHHTGQAL